ncbi:hypothetical protein L9F63_025701, partial [Diploptera punctata]
IRMVSKSCLMELFSLLITRWRLKMEGLERPRRKRGRPPKRQTSPEVMQDQEETRRMPDGRRRRKRKGPQRFKEAVQGKELERIFREEGVIDEDEPEEEEEDDIDDKANVGDHDATDAEIIGHLETQEGQDLGELVIVNRGRGKGRPRGKRRKIRFQCEICGRGFQHKGRYIVHKSYHKGVKFECSTCRKRFSSKENFDLHQKTTGHIGEGIIEGLEDGENTNRAMSVSNTRPFTCEVCGKTFAYQNSLKGHMLSHDEQKNEKGYPCDICGKMLNHPSSVVYHKEAEHNNGRRFVCNKCGKGFKHKQLLQRHQLVHSDDRRLTLVRRNTSVSCVDTNLHIKRASHCTTDGTQFKLHVKRHTGERPWKCDFCGKSFLHKDTWKCHTRRHKGERPYQCHYCARGFTEQWALKKHLRLHTGEKPYTCNVHRDNKDGASGGFSVDRTVWSIIRSHLSKEDTSEEGTSQVDMKQGEDGDGVQQIIYVTYQDPDDPSEAKTLHIVDGMRSDADAEASQSEQPAAVEGNAVDGIITTTPDTRVELNQLSEAGDMELSGTHSLQVTDEEGNPIHFTMHDGRQLQLTTTDGQSIQVMTTVDGQTIPLQLVTPEGHQIMTDVDNQLQVSHTGGENQGPEDDVSQLVEGEQAIEFMTQDGHKVRLVTSYDVDPLQLNADYLSTS